MSDDEMEQSSNESKENRNVEGIPRYDKNITYYKGYNVDVVFFVVPFFFVFLFYLICGGMCLIVDGSNSAKIFQYSGFVWSGLLNLYIMCKFTFEEQLRLFIIFLLMMLGLLVGPQMQRLSLAIGLLNISYLLFCRGYF